MNPLARIIFPFFGLLLVIGVIWQVVVIFQDTTKGTLELLVVPNDAKITIDGNTVKNGSIRLTEGKHDVKATRDGFANEATSATITAHATTNLNIAMKPNSVTGTDFLAANPYQAVEGEGIAGAQLSATAPKIMADNPILAILPYQGSNFKIDFGKSQKYPSDPNAVALYVTTPEPHQAPGSKTPPDTSGRTNAVKWITAHGYDPATLEIIYQYGF